MLLLFFVTAVSVNADLKPEVNFPNPGTNNILIPWDLKWMNNVNHIGNDKSQPEGTSDKWLKRQMSPGDAMEQDAMKVAARQAELQLLLQQIYQAEAAVKMETGEVTRTQQVALEAEQALEEATNKVRMLSADLQNAQEGAAQAAMRAHTAQLQLSAHDQLMFTARQRVDALSAQMVSVQADLASAQQFYTLNNSSQHFEQQAHLLQANPDQQAAIVSDAISQYPQVLFPQQEPMSINLQKYPWMVSGVSMPDNAKHSNMPLILQT